MTPLAALAAHLADARHTTLALVEDLEDGQLVGPRLSIVNPLLWELGHVAWFQEHWVLQHARALDTPRRDALYDSSKGAHETRWDVPLPARAATIDYLRATLAAVQDGLGREPGEQERYFLWLSLFHEDMHDEAFVMTRQTLGYPAPRFAGDRAPAVEPKGSAAFARGEVDLGALRGGDEFVFDNEKWSHPVSHEPFAISRAATTQGEFAAFVDDGGYLRRELWSEAGWRWREEARAERPVYWRREGGQWLRRHFDREVPLEPDQAMVHVCWWEAEAWCRWARRRLPTEAEWTRSGVGGRAGVWEWTSDDFLPFPGFSADPYEDYSRPWFGTHKVLKGGSWVTRTRLLRPGFRNFYTPERRDPFAGFRSCAA